MSVPESMTASRSAPTARVPLSAVVSQDLLLTRMERRALVHIINALYTGGQLKLITEVTV